MLDNQKSLIATGLMVCLAGALSAQQEDHTAPLPLAKSHSVTSAFGVTLLDEELIAGGPDYHAEFGPDGVTYLPATPTADRLYPLSMRVTGYGRGEPAIAPGSAERSDRGNTVFYARAGFVETYEAQQHGLKQSFVFSQLPAGSGDLVVRVAVETDLALTQTGDRGELTFLHGEDGGVTIGEVIGIDANGARCKGSMSYVGGSLDMRLPADFVEGAALPVVLDPLVGTAFGTNGLFPSTFDDKGLDVAYDATTNVYLATWTRTFSTGTVAVRAQRIDDAGGLVLSLISLGSPTSYVANSARVANIAAEDAFLVVYNAGTNDILGRAVLASSGVPSSVTVILDNADTLLTPDVGGEATENDDEALVVWWNLSQGTIQAKQVNVNGTVSPPTVFPFSGVTNVTTTSTNWSDSQPAISNSGGATGYFMVVWNRQFSGQSNTTVRGAILDRNVSLLDSFISITSTSNGDSDLPGVDGDGRNWIVAWENEAAPLSGDNNVQARSYGYDPNFGAAFNQSGIVDVEAGVGDDERAARVTWMGDSALIMHEDEVGAGSGNYDLYAQPVDLFTAEDCGARVTVVTGGGDQQAIRGASKAIGGAFEEDDALLVYSERDLTTNNGTGFAQRFRADDGVNVNLGGRCGSPGVGYASCATVGNNDFRFRLRGSRVSEAVWLLVSPVRIDFSCGSCTLVPDPFSGFTVGTTTDSNGDASILVPIPNDPALEGVSFFQQWLVGVPSGTTAGCASFGTDLSNAFETTIQ